MKKIILIMTAILLIVGSGCKKKDKNSLVGTWTRSQNNQTLTITFEDGGSFYGSVSGGDSFSGSYSTSGSELTVNTTDCSNPGKYTYNVDGNTATISVNSDDCTDRRNSAPGTYYRQ